MTPLPSALFSVFGAILAATAAGSGFIRLVGSGLTRREKVAWSFASGLLLQTICLLGLIAAGARPTGGKILILEIVAGSIASFYARLGRPPSMPPTGSRLVLSLLTCVAGAAWLVFLVGSLADSMWATDFLAFWGYKGKIVFLTGGIPRRLFQDPALYFAHPEYPLLVPLTFAALASFLGRWNDQALALLYPISALATLFAISGFLARRVSRVAGMAAAALAALCVFLYRPANAGTAEIPFALGLVLVISAALDSLRKDADSSAGRLAVASLFCAAVKPEGSLFVLLLALLLFLRTRRWRSAAALILPAAAHWILMRAIRGSAPSRDFDFSFFEPGRWTELAARLGAVAGRILGTEVGQSLVPILAIAVFFAVTRKGPGDPVIPVFVAQVFCYAVAFSVSAFDPLYAVASAFQRITMTLFPAFTLILGARLPTAFTDSVAAATTPRRPAAETAES